MVLGSPFRNSYHDSHSYRLARYKAKAPRSTTSHWSMLVLYRYSGLSGSSVIESLSRWFFPGAARAFVGESARLEGRVLHSYLGTLRKIRKTSPSRLSVNDRILTYLAGKCVLLARDQLTAQGG